MAVSHYFIIYYIHDIDVVFSVLEVDSSVLGTGESKYYLAGSSALIAALIFAIGWGINLIATRINRKKE